MNDRSKKDRYAQLRIKKRAAIRARDAAKQEANNTEYVNMLSLIRRLDAEIQEVLGNA